MKFLHFVFLLLFPGVVLASFADDWASSKDRASLAVSKPDEYVRLLESDPSLAGAEPSAFEAVLAKRPQVLAESKEAASAYLTARIQKISDRRQPSFKVNGVIEGFDPSSGVFRTSRASFTLADVASLVADGYVNFEVTQQGVLRFAKGPDTWVDVSGAVSRDAEGRVSISDGVLRSPDFLEGISLPKGASASFPLQGEEGFRLSGKDIRLPDGHVLESGAAFAVGRDHFVLDRGSSFSVAGKDGGVAARFSASQRTDVFLDVDDHTSNPRSYVQADERFGILTIFAKGGNELSLDVARGSDGTPVFGLVDVFAPDGFVVARDIGSGVSITASGEDLSYAGDVSRLGFSVRTPGYFIAPVAGRVQLGRCDGVCTPVVDALVGRREEIRGILAGLRGDSPLGRADAAGRLFDLGLEARKLGDSRFASYAAEAAPELRRMLAGSSLEARAARLALVGLSDPTAFPALVDALDGASPHDAARIEEAISSLSRDPRAVSILRSSLYDENPRVRQRAAVALAGAGSATPDELLPVLSEGLRSRWPDPAVVRALGVVAAGNDEVKARVLPELSRSLLSQDVSREARAAAADALVSVGDGALALPSLLAAARSDSSPDVRVAALKGVGLFGSASDADFVAAVLSDSGQDVRVRAGAAGALASMRGRLGDRRAAVLEALSDTLSVAERRIVDADPVLRASAARSLALIGGPDAIESIEFSAKQLIDTELEVESETGLRLGFIHIGGGYNLDASTIRRQAADVLGTIGSLPIASLADEKKYPYLATKVVPALGDALEDENSGVRLAAVKSLGGIGGARVVPLLASAVSDVELSVSTAAVESLAGMGPVGIPGLVAAVHSPYHTNRALSALGRLGPPALGELARLASSKERDAVAQSYARKELQRMLSAPSADMLAAFDALPPELRRDIPVDRLASVRGR